MSMKRCQGLGIAGGGFHAAAREYGIPSAMVSSF